MSRMLGAVPVLADSIVEQLCKASDRASDAHQQLGGQTEEDTAALSAAVWHSIWPVERCGAPVHGAALARALPWLLPLWLVHVACRTS